MLKSPKLYKFIAVLIAICLACTWAFNAGLKVNDSKPQIVTVNKERVTQASARQTQTQTELESRVFTDWNSIYRKQQLNIDAAQSLQAENEKIEEETNNLIPSNQDQQAYIETVLDSNIKAQLKKKTGDFMQSLHTQNNHSQTNEEPLFTEDELKQLESTNNGENDLIGGNFSGRSTTTSGPQALSQTSKKEEPEETTEEELEPLLFEGQARGYVMLYLMHPRARQTVEAQLNTLLKSEVRDIYLAVLTDGTFNKDFNYLTSVMKRLNDAKRWITLQLYLTNGSTMRNYDRTTINAGFNKIEPREFRNRIQFDPGIRSTFLNMVREVKPIFELNLSMHPKNRNIATVMLEDNLNEESYRAMRELAGSEIGHLVRFYRNPCEGCYEGNDGNSLGDPIEAHLPQALPFLTRRDGLNLDGTSYIFPWESGKGLSIPQVQEVANVSLAQGLQYFGLWREQRQGLTQGSRVHPDQRNYEVPTAEQLQIEIELLRQGLKKPDSNS